MKHIKILDETKALLEAARQAELSGNFIAAHDKVREAIHFATEKFRAIQAELLAEHIALNIGERDVHTQHCCVIHGCKYGDQDCPVETRASTQSYPCESCQHDW